MGQRLNIEIMKDGKLLANCYYHWGGYSHSAIELTYKILKHYNFLKYYLNEDEYGIVGNKDLMLALYLLKKTGAGLEEDEMKIAKDKLIINLEEDDEITLPIFKSRNDGIIRVSEEGLKRTRDWEEARVTIDIGTEKVDFDAVHYPDEGDINDYIEEGDVFEETEIRLKGMIFDDVFYLKQFIEKACYEERYYFHNKYDDSKFILIE